MRNCVPPSLNDNTCLILFTIDDWRFLFLILKEILQESSIMQRRLNQKATQPNH